MPDPSDKPKRHKNFKEEGILAAYKSAVAYINDNPKHAYCTIGPGTWLRYWTKEDKALVKVEEAKENIVLCYHEELDINFPPGVDPSKITSSKYDNQ